MTICVFYYAPKMFSPKVISLEPPYSVTISITT